MSGTKAALKAAKAALDANKYENAIDQAKTVLKTDPNNYHAYSPRFIALILLAVRLTVTSSNVFLGRALEKLDQNENSEDAYNTAIGIKDKDALAWQGLVGLYEKQAGKKLDIYHDAAVRLAEIHMDEYVGQRFLHFGWWYIVTDTVSVIEMTKHAAKQSFRSTQKMPKSMVREHNTNILWRFYCPPRLCMTISKVEFPNQLSHIRRLQT